MMLIWILFFLVVFVGVPGIVWLMFWGLGKLVGIFLPSAAPVGKWAGTVLAFGLLVCFLFGFTFGWRMVRVRHIEIPFEDLPASFDGYRIAHLSDWHLGTYSRNKKTIEREVDRLLGEKPDLVVFTGDIVNFDPEEIRPFEGILSRLDAPDGVWSVMGNHDYCVYYPGNTPELQAKNIGELQASERRMGWKMLLNESTVITRGTDSLALIGVENDGEPPFPQYADLTKAQAGLPRGIFKILMSHDPTHWRRSVLPDTGIGLMLAGHTHAWQFRLGRISPARVAFKEWGGLYEEGDRKLFVSTGSGGNIPFRFGAWPEVNILTLRKAVPENVIQVPLVEGDAIPAIQAAIERAESFGNRPVTIELREGDYHLYRKGSSQQLYHVSNTTSEVENPDPVKHIALWLRNLENVTIDGKGARLVTHGEVTGFVVDNCKNIKLKNFTYTAEDPTVVEFTVQEVGSKAMVVKLHPQSRYRIEDGRLSFFGDSWSWSDCIAQTYDPLKDITWRSWCPMNDLKRAVELEPGVLRLEYDRTPVAEQGQVFQLRDSFRDEVCGLIQYSGKVAVENVRFAFTGNFSVVGQMSEDLTFRNVTFEPEEGSGRTCAGFADFLHFSGCKGKVLIEDSKFNGSQDDPINVHGTHLQVQEFVSERELRVRYMHPQTFGFQPFLKGDEVDLVDAHTLIPAGSFKVRKSEMLSDREVLVTLEEPVSSELRSGRELVLENVTCTPEVVIRNNWFSRGPTRGILVSTRRKVLIENNTFVRIPGSSVLIADDARSWFESGLVRDVTIRNNRFIECGLPVISIAPENDEDGGCVHSNISVEDNYFKLTGQDAIRARSVDGLSVRHNVFELAGDYRLEDLVRWSECRNVTLE